MKDLELLLKSGKVKGLADDSRRVKAGDIFFSFPVNAAENFALKAKESGAIAIVSESSPIDELKEIWFQVPSVKEARLKAAEIFYKNPFQKLRVHGVTGTNGKTTSAFLMREMLNASGFKTALLGTICNQILDEKVPASLTTPGLLDLFAFARKAVDKGVTDLVMEVSSHSLDQGRVDGILFHSALFSNLTQDHLDYHKTMENYFAAKTLLFTKYLAKDGVAVLNIDSPYGEKLSEISENKTILVSKSSQKNANIFLKENAKMTENGIAFTVPAIASEPFETKLCGEFNVDNCLLVLGFAYANGISKENMQKALSKIQVPGRFEKVYDKNGIHVIVDYAHTPDALERILKTARGLCKKNLFVVFGCGGDRDKTKRPLMGRIAEQNADKVFVTSDNPRTEDPEVIIQDIVSSMKNYTKYTDRKTAIQKACAMLTPGDWLVIAGKGHENYQIIGNVKHHFDDSEEVKKVFSV